MQRIITLTTDFGHKDYYVGALKGKIFSNVSGCNLVDISHEIANYNIEQAGFVIAAAYDNFPKGTVHIIAVDCSISDFTPAICVQFDDHFFITADNGILTLLLQDKKFQQAVLISHDGSMKSNDVFVYCAYQLFENRAMDQIGLPLKSLKTLSRLGDTLIEEQHRIIGKVIYEDNFGNLVTNISRQTLERVGKGRAMKIHVKTYVLRTIQNHFSDFKVNDANALKEKAGELIALYSDMDLLMITLYYSTPFNPGGCAKSLLNTKVNDNILITFEQ